MEKPVDLATKPFPRKLAVEKCVSVQSAKRTHTISLRKQPGQAEREKPICQLEEQPASQSPRQQGAYCFKISASSLIG